MAALRSYLFVPGNRPERFIKACESGADVVIIDLEDSVAFDDKAKARDTVMAWLSETNPVYVRVNGPDTEWFEDDVKVLQRPGVIGVVLPKTEERNQVVRLAGFLSDTIHIAPIVESARGIWNLLDIASAPQVERLIFGSFDLQLDANILGDHEELLYARSRMVLASRVAGILPPLDTITIDLDNEALLIADVQRARRLGFGGKMCIHPKQIKAINEGFRSTDQEIAWAQMIMEAVKIAGESATRFQGRMIDRPVIEKAKRILDTAAG